MLVQTPTFHEVSIHKKTLQVMNFLWSLFIAAISFSAQLLPEIGKISAKLELATSTIL